MFNYLKAVPVAIVMGAAVLASALPQKAQAADFSGETIEWVIPFREGGGSDKWARYYAPMLSEALPGQPNVVVKNMPGAGSTKGANWFSSRAKPDGLTIFGSGGSTQLPFLLGDKRVEYDYADWNVVLASASGGVVYLTKELGDQWQEDPQSVIDSTTFIVGSQGATRLDLVPLLAWDMLGMNVQPVFGIKGRSGGRLMFERQEANMDWQTSSGFLSGVQPLVDEGAAVPIMTFGAVNAQGDIVRDPTFPDLPTFKEVYTQVKGAEPSGELWDAWKAFFVAGFPAQKMVFLPKGTPDDIVNAYSDAFEAVIASQEFADTSEKILGIYTQSTREAAGVKLKLGTQVESEAKQLVKDWLVENFNVQLN